VKVVVRDAFIPSAGHVFVSADYSQIELRILAFMSQDERLLKLLGKEHDVFKLIAAELNNIPLDNLDKVTDMQRSHAKHICYGILYGMGANSLAEILKLTKQQASSFLNAFKITYAGVTKYMSKVIQECKRDGFVETMYGRRRYLGHINSTNSSERSKAERQALNSVCQGSAADIVKQAMVRIVDRVEKANSTSRLLLQLHDELLFEVPTHEFDKIITMVKHTMENVVQETRDKLVRKWNKNGNDLLRLPIRISSGYSWGSMQPIDKK